MSFDLTLGKNISHKIKTKFSKRYIFCVIRKKWYVLTPEEWVRQYWLTLLINNGIMPININLEVPVLINGMTKRIDILIYNKAKPWVIIECKSDKIALNPPEFNQLVRYQNAVNASYIILTNGKEQRAFKVSENQLEGVDLNTVFQK
jgi:hypothetical protein